LHFSAFHPDFKMLDVPPTPPATLTRARERAKAVGIHHVYTGNVSDVEGQSTYCGSCGKRLIERDWYALGEWNLTPQGHCRFCDAPLAGRFDARPARRGPAIRRVLRMP
ncbi:MAG: AmmeMemoRadiSam system radical SAM enzyme, partial [Sandaracinaceae bacterium]|nr:AmmeMemoRadiSam system radical SAM enzyme [Sandaracinaceae bacterium]